MTWASRKHKCRKKSVRGQETNERGWQLGVFVSTREFSDHLGILHYLPPRSILVRHSEASIIPDAVSKVLGEEREQVAPSR